MPRDEIPVEATALVCRLLARPAPTPGAQRCGAARHRAHGRRHGATALHRRPVGHLGARRRHRFGIGSRAADPSHGGRDPVPLANRASRTGLVVGGISRAMLALARQHAVDRGAVRQAHRIVPGGAPPIAETLVAIEGAEATLKAADDDLGCLLAKAAAGQAALTAAKHRPAGDGRNPVFHRRTRPAPARETCDGARLLGSARTSPGEGGGAVAGARPARLAKL